MKTTAIIDGDTIIYQATSSSEKVIQWDEFNATTTSDLRECAAKFDGKVEEIQRDLNADEVLIALSDSERWRPSVMPAYKHNRTGRKPLNYGQLRAYCEENYLTYIRPTLEGDDILGILATHPKLIPGKKIIVAIDKDLRQIPGTLYNYDKKELREISDLEADRFFYTQTLTGDVTDGYKGCPGIGAKKAATILAPFFGDEGFDHRGAWVVIVAAYEKAGLSEVEALQNARVARICRNGDYDFDTKEVVLWNPAK